MMMTKRIADTRWVWHYRIPENFSCSTERITKLLNILPTVSFDRTFGDIDAAEGKLQKPLKLLISESQQIYVLEPERLCVYDVYGNFVQEIGKDVLHQACGFCIAPEKIWVVSPDTLYCFSLDGRQSAALPAKKIMSEAPLQNIRDIGAERKFYLSAHKQRCAPDADKPISDSASQLILRLTFVLNSATLHRKRG